MALYFEPSHCSYYKALALARNGGNICMKLSQVHPALYLCSILHIYFHHGCLRCDTQLPKEKKAAHFELLFVFCMCGETKQFPTPVLPTDAKLLSPCLGQMAESGVTLEALSVMKRKETFSHIIISHRQAFGSGACCSC